MTCPGVPRGAQPHNTPVSALLQAVIPMEQLKDYIAYARMR